MAKQEIKSPLPGTFYRRPDPEKPEFKKDGDSVSADDVIGLVEVMKTFHEIKSGVTGNGLKFMVDDAEPVMAGQVLAEAEG